MNNLGLEEYEWNDLCELTRRGGNTNTPSETDPEQVSAGGGHFKDRG